MVCSVLLVDDDRAFLWRPRVVLTSTDRLPFVPKEELGDDSVRRLLMTR